MDSFFCPYVSDKNSYIAYCKPYHENDKLNLERGVIPDETKSAVYSNFRFSYGAGRF